MNKGDSLDGIKLALRVATLLRETPDPEDQELMSTFIHASLSELWSGMVFFASILNSSFSHEAFEALGLAALEVEGLEGNGGG